MKRKISIFDCIYLVLSIIILDAGIISIMFADTSTIRLVVSACIGLGLGGILVTFAKLINAINKDE